MPSCWIAKRIRSHWGLIFNKETQVFSPCPYHSPGGSSAPKERTLGVGLGDSAPLYPRERALVPGWLMRAGLLTEGPPLQEDAIICGSSLPQRSHILWVMFHSELPSLPTGTALCIDTREDQIVQQSSSNACVTGWVFLCTHVVLTCHFSPFMGICVSSLFFHTALCVFFIFTSGCYRSAEGIHSTSDDSACLLNAMRLRFSSGYIKTVNIVAWRNVLCLHIYEFEFLKGNMYWV